MARRWVKRGETRDGKTAIVAVIVDADARARDEVIEWIEASRVQGRIDELVNGGQFERWPHD